MPASKLYTRTVVDSDVRRVRTRRGSVHGMSREPVHRMPVPASVAPDATRVPLSIRNPPARRARKYRQETST